MTYAPKVIIRLIVVTALALTGLVAVVAATPAQATVSATYLTGYERQVVDAINVERTRRGLAALRYTSCPDGYGERWALRLRTSSTLYHQSMSTVMSGCGATRRPEHRPGPHLGRGPGPPVDGVARPPGEHPRTGT